MGRRTIGRTPYDVLTFLQTIAFVCSTCVDLDFGVESSLLVRYGLFGVVLISFLLFSELTIFPVFSGNFFSS